MRLYDHKLSDGRTIKVSVPDDREMEDYSAGYAAGVEAERKRIAAMVERKISECIRGDYQITAEYMGTRNALESMRKAIADPQPDAGE